MNEKEMALQLAKEKITAKYLRLKLVTDIKWEILFVIITLAGAIAFMVFTINEFGLRRDSFDVPEMGIVYAILLAITAITCLISIIELCGSIKSLTVLDQEPEATVAEYIIDSLPTFISD